LRLVEIDLKFSIFQNCVTMD